MLRILDFNPLDGTADVTYTLNRIQVQKIFDPDRLNTDMHIWATGRIALVWGEDPDTANPENPYIDAGYTVLPIQLLPVTPPSLQHLHPPTLVQLQSTHQHPHPPIPIHI